MTQQSQTSPEEKIIAEATGLIREAQTRLESAQRMLSALAQNKRAPYFLIDKTMRSLEALQKAQGSVGGVMVHLTLDT